MSGIAALLWKSGRDASEPEIERLGERLAHRGPDAAGHFVEGPAGLAQRSFWTTPEAERESLPLVLPDLVLVADARLDDREGLLERLGSSADPSFGDVRLIAEAYRRFGENAPRHLVGDFSFCLWDRQRRLLLAARDPFGIKPLYYHDGPERFFLGSEMKAFLPEVPRQLDEDHLGLFLDWTTHDESSTFYQAVRRLPPGQMATIEDGRVKQRTFYGLDTARELPPAREEERCEEFAALFRKAVRARLRSRTPVASMLSGGLDSSAIVCEARKLLADEGREPLRTYSLVFDSVRACDERPFIEAVISQGGVEPHLVRADALSPLSGWQEMLRDADQACYGANLYLNRELYRRTAEAGSRVLLDGADGDTVVGYGFERLLELALGFRWGELRRELEAAAPRVGQSPRSLFRQFVLRPILAEVRRRTPRPLLGAWRTLRRKSPPAVHSRTLAPAFAARTDLAVRLAAAEPPPVWTEREAHLQALRSGAHTAAFELLDASAARLGVEPRYPFFDRRLVEYCLALPADFKLRQGWTRWIERQALPSLPDTVRWRGWKTLLGPGFARNLAIHDLPLIDRVLERQGPLLAPYVDLEVLRGRRRRFSSSRRHQDGQELCMATFLALWLETRG